MPATSGAPPPGGDERRASPAARLGLSPLDLLAGCAGYAADYWKPKNNLIAPQLPRYGVTAEQSRCVGERLTKNLSVWQLRQLADIARRLVPKAGNPLSPRDLAYVAGLVQDPKVGPEVEATLEACGATKQAAAVAAPAPTTEPGPAVPGTGALPGIEPGAAPPQALRWVDLG